MTLSNCNPVTVNSNQSITAEKPSWWDLFMLFHPKFRIYYPPISMRGIRQMPGQMPLVAFWKKLRKNFVRGTSPTPCTRREATGNQINLFPETAKAYLCMVVNSLMLPRDAWCAYHWQPASIQFLGSYPIRIMQKFNLVSDYRVEEAFLLGLLINCGANF